MNGLSFIKVLLVCGIISHPKQKVHLKWTADYRLVLFIGWAKCFMKGAFKELISLIFGVFFVFCFWGFVIVCQSERHTNSFLFRIIKHSTEKKKVELKEVDNSECIHSKHVFPPFERSDLDWKYYIFFYGNDEYLWGRRGLKVITGKVCSRSIKSDYSKRHERVGFFYILKMKWFILKTMNILAIECSKDAYNDAELSCLILTMCSWGDKMKF